MTIVLITVLAYLAAAVMLAYGSHHIARGNARTWLLPAWLAIVLHATYHVAVAMRMPGGPDMHFFAAASLVGLGMAALTSLVAQRGRMAALGVVVYPLAAILLLAYHLHGHMPSPALDWRLQLHAWLALLAYATLGIAALLALMLWLQERALRRRDISHMLRALPPLTELETLMFRTIAAGFVLLTLVLLTGMLFVQDFMAQKLVHKTVLSFLSWLVFGGLLLGRWRYGWRGTKAIRWTLAAMVLLVLAFFGSKLVIELVHNRPGA